MFKYRKQLTLGLVIILILSLAASLFSGVMTSEVEESATTSCEQSDTREIQSLIQNQAFAFKSQNVSAAYSYFSENFREDVDIERFSLIVGTNYPMLLSGSSLAFGECRVIDIGYAQAVTVTTDDSQARRLIYFLTRVNENLAVEGITVEE